MFRIRNILRQWLPLAVVVTLLSGLIYSAVQQVLRLSANDPQIAMARDSAAALTMGASIESQVPATPVDIAASLAPYLVVYDQTGQPVAGSGRLHGALPALPNGVFDHVRRQGLDKISWQPERGVRSAVVVALVGGANPGFVMAGRSLSEVENRIRSLGNLVLVGWWATLAAALIAVIAVEFIFRRPEG
jgi:hypothetical protein